MRAFILAGISFILLAFAVAGDATASAIHAEETAPLPGMSLFGVASADTYLLTQVDASGAIERWYAVLLRHKKDNAFASGNDSMSRPVRRQWEALKAKIPAMSALKRLRAVNAFFNQVPSKSDLDNYGEEEYWAIPAEFMRKYSGDCDDIAIAKYLALRHVNWPQNDLWLVLVRDVPHKAGHAVVAARSDGQIFILDNLNRPKDRLVPHEKQAALYRPLLALNETTVWVFPATHN